MGTLKKNVTEFLASLDKRKEKERVQTGTIRLRSYDEFIWLVEALQGKIIKPIHAAKMLGVSRAMIFQLEREGRITAYRLSFTDDVWKTVPLYLKTLISRDDTYIWIPLEDIEKYAKETGREIRKAKQKYINDFIG